MTMHGFEELKCGANANDNLAYASGAPVVKCGSTQFIAVQNLIWKDGAGMSVKPAGYQCAKCGAVMDNSAGITAIRKQHNLDKIKELEASE